MPRQRSPLWNHFQITENNKAKCKYCSQHVSVTSGSIGNLTRHLKTKHPTINFDNKRINKGNARINEDVNDDNDDIVCNSDIQEVVGILNSNIATTSNQTNTQLNIKDFFVKPVALCKSKQFDEQLIKMIVKEFHPFSIVEDPEFVKFVKLLCPGYSLPTRKTVSNNLLQQLYLSNLEKVKINFKEASAVCLTTDSWTSINNESFTAITAHYLDSKLKLKSILLECLSFHNRHTAENISICLKDCVRNFHLQEKIVCCITDNAANEVAAIRLCNWRHLPCFAHSLNLALQQSLKEISNITIKVKSIVEYFKRNAHALSKLQSIQEQMKSPKLKLKQDVITRWNSTYDMLNRILQIKDSIVSTIAVLQCDVPLLTGQEWYVIEKSVEILKMFDDITTEMSAEKNITISKIIPLVNVMNKKVNDYYTDKTAPIEIMQMIQSLKDSLNHRFKYVEDNELMCQATILDPRFKKYGFSNETKFSCAYETLKLKVSAVKLNELQSTGNETLTVSQPTSSNIWEDFDKKVKRLCGANNPTASAIIELNKYLQEPLLQRTEDPLIWWKERRMVYPRLYQIVTRRLCIMSTSVPCERTFSKAGQVLTQRRNRLTSSKVNQIMFLNHNL
jgi:zinc finger BED domain-containing protein 1 (E3 SUMO-protein ligase ZBED1)